MSTHRRGLLAGLGLTALASAAPAVAQTPPTAPKPPLAERLAAEAAKHRLAVSFDGDTVSGPGLDRILQEARAARFLLLGEEHGVAQAPILSQAVFKALAPSGYSRLAIEVSPPAARALDEAATGGVEGLKRFAADHPPGPAFYTMAEEARMLAAVRAAIPGPEPVLLGLDYEVLQDRLLIGRLEAAAPASARAPLAALKAASDKAWAAYANSRNIGQILPFSGDPALVRAVRAAWPKPDAASWDILETLEQTLAINQHQTAERYFLSNDARAQFNRANWARFWRAEGAKADPARVMLKFGAGHMVRGRSPTEVYDLGSLVSETAVLRGETSFHLLVIPADGGRQAVLNGETLRYDPHPVSTVQEMALQSLQAAALAGSSTLFDLRPLRRLMPGSVTRDADARLSRVIHGFDALLLVAGSTASGNL